MWDYVTSRSEKLLFQNNRENTFLLSKDDYKIITESEENDYLATLFNFDKVCKVTIQKYLWLCFLCLRSLV